MNGPEITREEKEKIRRKVKELSQPYNKAIDKLLNEFRGKKAALFARRKNQELTRDQYNKEVEKMETHCDQLIDELRKRMVRDVRSKMSDAIAGRPYTKTIEVFPYEPKPLTESTPKRKTKPRTKKKTVRKTRTQPNRLTTLKIISSLDELITPTITREFLRALHTTNAPPITFTIVGNGSVPESYPTFACPKNYAVRLEKLLSTYYPNTEFEPETLEDFPDQYRIAADYYVRKDTSLLCCFTSFQPDPLAVVFNTMEDLQDKQFAMFSIHFSRASQKQIEATQYKWKFGLTLSGGGMKQFVPPTRFSEKKNTPPFWIVTVRLQVASTQKKKVTSAFLSRLAQPLKQFKAETQFYHWTPAAAEELKASQWADSKKRSIFQQWYGIKTFEQAYEWSLLNTNELLGLVHLPHKSITSEILMRTTTKSKAVPDLLTHGGITLGTNEHRHKTKQVKLPNNLRNRHIYIVGATRQGKSTLMTNLVKQDIEHSAGFAVVDPHGDLIEDILALIPKKRISDTILFNAQDRDHPVTLNVMTAESEQETEQVAADFMITFQRLFSDSWGTRMEYILRNAIDTLLNAGNKAFPDIRRILVNSSFRENVLDQITNPYLLEFWEEEFPNLPRSSIDPILNKLHQFQRTAVIRNILGQPKSKLNFYTAMQTKKILLVNLGNINADDKHLLGSLIVSQLQLAAMRRGSLPPKKRIDFTIYIDEFQNFITSAFDTILSEAAKFKINLVIAHQFVSQIPNKIRASIFGNAGTMIYFNLGIDDANYLRPVLGDFDPEDVAKLPQGNTITFVRQAGDLFPMHTYPPAKKPKQTFIDQIINHSRTEYGTPREELEQRTKPKKQKQQDQSEEELNLDDFSE